jgi:nickel transport protein
MNVALTVSSLLCVGLLLAPARSAAHGAHGHHGVGQAVVVTLESDHGPVAAGWRCTIFAPGGEPWSEGTLDRHGRIAFVPDRPGAWRVRGFASDGHGADIEVTVDEALLTALQVGGVTVRQDDARGLGARSKLVVGVGVLVGIFGAVALIQSRRS